MHTVGPLKRSRRIPVHITISHLTGEAHATDATNQRTYRFGREQLESFADYDSLLRRRRYLDESEAIPSAYELWCRLWEQDRASQYGWATITSGQVVLNLDSDPVPTNLLLPRLKAKDDEVLDQKFVKGLVKAAAKNYVREQSNRDWHVSKRAEKRARREALSSHAARLAHSASLSDLDEVSSIFDLTSELPLPFEDGSTAAGPSETTTATHTAAPGTTSASPPPVNTDTDTDATPAAPLEVATAANSSSTVAAPPLVPPTSATHQNTTVVPPGPTATIPTPAIPAAGPSSARPAARKEPTVTPVE